MIFLFLDSVIMLYKCETFLRQEGLLGLILKCMVEEKNFIGRPQLQFMSQIIEDQELKRKAHYRVSWKLL
jgi:hypothetical protein